MVAHCVYFPEKDQRATIDLRILRAQNLRAWWFDPRLGIGNEIHSRIAGKQEFVSPPYGPDWVLVVDDAGAQYAPPGLNAPSVEWAQKQ